MKPSGKPDHALTCGMLSLLCEVHPSEAKHLPAAVPVLRVPYDTADAVHIYTQSKMVPMFSLALGNC